RFPVIVYTSNIKVLRRPVESAFDPSILTDCYGEVAFLRKRKRSGLAQLHPKISFVKILTQMEQRC
ncbi:hypothetical protein, partial [Acetobacter cibinongensis]|uniref:hypothetical protein n=1 Tax=Acetobacter cibinongensis TaxID=146475 RepID=UPI00222E4445